MAERKSRCSNQDESVQNHESICMAVINLRDKEISELKEFSDGLARQVSYLKATAAFFTDFHQLEAAQAKVKGLSQSLRREKRKRSLEDEDQDLVIEGGARPTQAMLLNSSYKVRYKVGVFRHPR